MTRKKGEISERERQRRLAQAASQKNSAAGQGGSPKQNSGGALHPGAVAPQRTQKATNRGQ